MSILRIIFALLKNLDGDLSVPDITSLQNIFSILSEGDITQSSINALRKAVANFSDKQLKKTFKMKFNIADMSPTELRRNMRAIQTEKQAQEVIKNDIKRQLKELEQAQALALQKTIQQDREVLNMLKKVFAVLEANLYERLAVYTPVDTGNLLSSVYAKHVGSLAIQIGFNTVQAPYAIYVHEILGNRHPNGGIPQFLLTAFLEAWAQTMASAESEWQSTLAQGSSADVVARRDMFSFFINTLKTMNYGIDISKNKLAVTISLASDSPLTNLNSTVLDIMDATKDNPAHAKSKAEALFKDYKETLFNYLNDTNLSYEQIASLSYKGRKKLNLLTLNREYSQDHKSNKTWRQRQQRLKNVAAKLHRFNIEEKNDILRIKTSATDRDINTAVFNSDTSSALAVRLAAEGKFIKTKIVYPLILDKVDRQYKKQDRLERQAELDAEDEELQELYWSQHASYDDVLEMEASRAEQQAEYDDEEFDDDELLEDFEEQEVDANTANIYEMLRGGMKTLEPDKPANPFDDMDNETLFDMLENADEYGLDDKMYSTLEALAESRFGG